MNLIRLIIIFMSFAFAQPVHAAQAEVNVLKIFKEIPILDNGRIKPLDTYARNVLLQFSAKDTYEGKPAILWLARLLFTPDATKDDKIFLINNPDIATALKIEPDHTRRYSFTQLQKNYPKLLELYNAALKIPEKQRSIVEAEIIRVFENLRAFAELSHDMQFAFVHDDFSVSNSSAQMLNLKGEGKYSFLDIALTADDMREATKELAAKDPSSWSDEEKEIMGLLNNLFHWSLNYRDLKLNVIPSHADSGIWISPWDAIGVDFKNEDTRQAIVLWRDMAQAFSKKEQVEFDLAARQYVTLMSGHYQENKFTLELIYNDFRPFFVAKVFYIFALIFFVVSFMSAAPIYYQLAWGSMLCGFIPHALALIARIIIMARPPVTSLYETFIFVSFITVLLGLLIELINKRWLGLVVAGISGTALLFIASKYSAEGDTLKMLVAVLNSNFWLGTHVLTITMGYGATCVAGVIGHIWLLQRVFKPTDTKLLETTHKTLIGMLGLALTLTFLGTNLGGIWADQSWGRFWGWDPKENGALMIVLWTAMLFHAKIGRMIKQTGLAVGAVLGMVVVMWAWFGVNLLSIGLHSYGFTSGIATTLAIYVICEIMFLLITTYIIRRH